MNPYKTVRYASMFCVLVMALFSCKQTEDDSGENDPVQEEALRSLTTFSLFGSMPENNLVDDPNFSQVSYVWMAFHPQNWQHIPALRRVDLPKTPTNQPALLVYGNKIEGTQLIGSARSYAEPMDVSMYVARPLGENDPTLAKVSASVLGVFRGSGEQTVDLQQEDDDLVIDDIVWKRYSTHLSTGPVGAVTLVVTDLDTADLLMTGPVVAASSRGNAMTAMGSVRALKTRRPTEQEHVASARFFDLQRQAARERKKQLDEWYRR